MTLALIDGDEAIFKAAVIKQEELDWNAEAFVERLPTFAEARRTLDSLIDKWTADAGCDEPVIVLSPDDRKLFRRGLHHEYKAGRSDKPAHFWELVEHLRSKYPCEAIDGLEADDVMGLLSGDGRVIVSSDKDMRTVPGRLYSPKQGKGTLITPTRADWQWMYQTLMGDSTDGFKGCLGCGPKGAEEILDDATSLDGWWPLVVDAFERPKKGKYREVRQTRKDALIQAQLARILRPREHSDGYVRYRLGNETIYINVRQLAR